MRETERQGGVSEECVRERQRDREDERSVCVRETEIEGVCERDRDRGCV